MILDLIEISVGPLRGDKKRLRISVAGRVFTQGDRASVVVRGYKTKTVSAGWPRGRGGKPKRFRFQFEKLEVA